MLVFTFWPRFDCLVVRQGRLSQDAVIISEKGAETQLGCFNFNSSEMNDGGNLVDTGIISLLEISCIRLVFFSISYI
jgi:hypothetical protein